MTVINVTDATLKGTVKGPTFDGNVDGSTFSGSVTYTDTTEPPVEPPVGTKPDAPTITLVRTVGTHNDVFNIAKAGKTMSSHLAVYGQSVAGATVSVYVDGALDGTATVDADGWFAHELKVLSDAGHAITASADGSDKSASYDVTVIPGLTGLPVAVGGNITNNKSLSWGGENFSSNSTSQKQGQQNNKCCIVEDTHTLDFTLLASDVYPDWPSNRSELAFTGRYADGVTHNITYEVWLDPASPINNNFGPGQFVVFSQIHDSGGSSPPFDFTLGGSAAHTTTTGDQICVDGYDGAKYFQIYMHPRNLERGVWHSIDIILKMHRTAGVAKVWLDREQVANYAGALYGLSPYYWKLGMYRGATAGYGTVNQTQRYKYRNFLCVRT